jgi:hypothetical protein
MKKQILMGLASLMLIGTAGIRAAENKESAPKPPAGEQADRKKPAPENLTPEERAKRRKEAIEKRDARLKELRDKKAAGTLNDVEKRQLERLEQQADRAKRAKSEGGPARPRKSKQPETPAQQAQ